MSRILNKPAKISLFVLVGFLVVLIFSLMFTGCTGKGDKFVIISGSENDTLEPLVKQFAKDNRVDIEMKYQGSVEIMQQLQKDNVDFDAVWPANSLWISLGDKQHLVKHSKSVMTSPVVFGIRKSLAKDLGFIGKQVSVKDILNAINNKKLSFMMTSATQSNSGACAYMGFLYAFLGNPETITMEDLRRPQLRDQIRGLLSGINRSSGSSGWLKDLFLQGNYDAMVNYEALIIETNEELIKAGREPLYVVYPYDGLVIADTPLGYVNRGDNRKEEVFKKLQAHLLSEKVQKNLLDLGRRTGFGGAVEGADNKVFNPDWGIDAKKILSPIKLPTSEVIMEALNLYQTEFKKPSNTIFCLDYSGSMSGDGEAKLKEAMALILNQEAAKTHLIQSSQEDVITVVAFSDRILAQWQVRGNDSKQLGDLLKKVQDFKPQGGTDIYTPVVTGLDLLKKEDMGKYISSVVLMTDGQSNTGMTFQSFESRWKSTNNDIPVFSIIFGSASEDQLKQIANLTKARVFDGKKDLVDAFKKVRGYN